MTRYLVKRSGRLVEFSSEDFRFIKERQVRVLKLRAEPNPTPLSEIADQLGVTPERVRQIRNAALRKISEGRAADEEKKARIWSVAATEQDRESEKAAGYRRAAYARRNGLG